MYNETFLNNKQENDYNTYTYDTIYDVKLVNNFIYIPNTRITEGNYNIFNIYNVYNKNKILHNVIKVNDMQKINYPIYYNLYYTKDYFIDTTYIYSIPRGTDNINYIICITTFEKFERFMSTIFKLYMIMNNIFYNSLILRAVLDYHDKTVLLYPFMLIKRKDVLKQIIISLHDIKKIKKINNYIKIYIKPKNIQDKHMKSWSFLNMLPYYFPRYNFSKNNILSKNKDEDMLYPYDFNNLNIAVFDKKLTNSSNITSMKIQKNVQGFPLNVHEENKLLSLLKL
ncbi:hypothetical protein PFLG_01890 [Plasmodium falciparum RAJ116]|uniref:Uncharacterized protein n=1 Tax=Plasmodium falciparum RAJ116 TaxID=580058 RepID=A0A0L0CW70_PLAFA|nr:hypothetical protein PFLG_01890 [Plasmodium falciparum RAJ116]